MNVLYFHASRAEGKPKWVIFNVIHGARFLVNTSPSYLIPNLKEGELFLDTGDVIMGRVEKMAQAVPT